MISAVCWMFYVGVCVGVAMASDIEADQAGVRVPGRLLIAVTTFALAPALVGGVLIALLHNVSKSAAAARS